MAEPTLFTKIINGEIPSHKIYEDELTFVFLTIAPHAEGHCLVIPKKEADKIYDLPDEDYEAVMRTVKKVAIRIQQVYRPARVGIQVQGFEIPHAHVHVLPIDTPEQLNTDHKLAQPADEDMVRVADKLRFS